MWVYSRYVHCILIPGMDYPSNITMLYIQQLDSSMSFGYQSLLITQQLSISRVAEHLY